MKPLAVCANLAILTHPLIARGLADPIHYIHCDPFHDPKYDAANAARWWALNPGRTRAVQFGFLGVEGFDVDRVDANGELIGCTRQEFDDGVESGMFKKARDVGKLQAAREVFNAANLMPEVVHIDHEPTTTPSHTTPMPDRAKFNALRCGHFANMLMDAGLVPAAKHVVVEFTQFSRLAKPYGTDYNGARVPFNVPRPRFRSSCEFYSADPVNTTTRLAAWLAACEPGAMPLLSANNAKMLEEQLDLCEQYGATPILYFDRVLGGSETWQAGQAEWVLANRGGG